MYLSPASHWRTARVELFVLEPEHVGPHYTAWLADPIVVRFLENRFQTHSEDSVRAFVRHCRDDATTLFLGVRSLMHDGRHVGNIKLAPIYLPHGVGEIGIMIGDRSVWGQGIASDALTALSNIAQRQLGLRKLTAGCYESNLGSRKAFANAGFEVEGERRRHFLLDGRAESLVLMAKWLEQSPPTPSLSR